jgi:hypothetical protein
MLLYDMENTAKVERLDFESGDFGVWKVVHLDVVEVNDDDGQLVDDEDQVAVLSNFFRQDRKGLPNKKDTSLLVGSTLG